MEKQDYYQNHFLIAMPGLDDLNFTRAVIFVEEHNEDGAIGVVINKPLHLNIGNMMEHLNIPITDNSISNQPVFMGGPVGQDQGFVLHRPFPNDQSNEDQDAEIIISASKEILRSIASNTGPPEYIIALGYSGWEPGQLEIEIQQNDWLTVPCDPNILFNTPSDQRWSAAGKLLGIDVNQLSDLSGHA